MKKFSKLILSILTVSLLLFPSGLRLANAQEELPKVTVTTTFLADIVERLAPDTFEVVSIVPAGGDPHIYTASASDLSHITEAELVLFHGLHFEAQMASVLETLPNSQAVTADFDESDLIYVSEDSQEVDPHYWFNLNLYKQSVETTKNILAETFPEKADLVNANSEAYLKELDELSEWVDQEIEKLPVEERILVTPHDAFTYFAQTHNFTVYAPQGISTESEVSNEAIVNTVNFIVENDVPAIFLDTTSNPQAMEKLREGVEQQNAQVSIIGGEGQELYSDSLAAVGQPNDNYIDMYRHNVSLIVDNLVR